uniref:Secreted protein n=1 Tax=Ascaris lumbricoides TaxID=6252 RepID=A0A0M3HLD5_ASCLU
MKITTCIACITSATLVSLNPDVRSVDCKLSRKARSSLLPSPCIGLNLNVLPAPFE